MCISSGILSANEIEQVIRLSGLCTLAIIKEKRHHHNGYPDGGGPTPSEFRGLENNAALRSGLCFDNDDNGREQGEGPNHNNHEHKESPLLFVCEYRVQRDQRDLEFVLNSAVPNVLLPDIRRREACALQFQVRTNCVLRNVICYGFVKRYGDSSNNTLVVRVEEIFGREFCLG